MQVFGVEFALSDRLNAVVQEVNVEPKGNIISKEIDKFIKTTVKNG